jgi:hypothetical protein
MRGREVQGAVIEERNEGLLLVIAEPLDVAERLCDRMAKVRGVVDGALLLEADPAWANPINNVLVHKGVRVKRLGCEEGVVAVG